MSEAELLKRASDYVLGRLSAAERERAERDLETDASLRTAVMVVAERMRESGANAAPPRADWGDLAQRLASLPHMQGAVPAPRLVSAREAVAPARVPLRRRVARAWRALFRRADAPVAVALLTDEARHTAVLEAWRGGRLRLLVLSGAVLRKKEELALWAHAAGGGRHRLARFRADALVWLKADDPAWAPDAVRVTLTTERSSSFGLGEVVLAEGRLTGFDGLPHVDAESDRTADGPPAAGKASWLS